MSIIERVLAKQRAGTTEEESKPIGRHARIRGSITAGVSRASELRPPQASIQLDLDTLRSAGLLPPAEFTNQLVEQYRRIKWRLLEMPAEAGESQGKIVNLTMVASSVEGEGKSFTSVNLALSIAREKDLSVLLVDADVAKRHLSQLFGCEQRPGLVDAAMDGTLDPEDLVLGTGIPGLTFLPAGRQTSTAPELFASERVSALVRRLGEVDARRIVLFDSSPLLSTNEAQVLSHLVDQVLLVVRAESTPQALALEAIDLLDASKPVRCVLNQARIGGLESYYYGYYGYYPNDQLPPQA